MIDCRCGVEWTADAGGHRGLPEWYGLAMLVNMWPRTTCVKLLVVHHTPMPFRTLSVLTCTGNKSVNHMLHDQGPTRTCFTEKARSSLNHQRRACDRVTSLHRNFAIENNLPVSSPVFWRQQSFTPPMPSPTSLPAYSAARLRVT